MFSNILLFIPLVFFANSLHKGYCEYGEATITHPDH